MESGKILGEVDFDKVEVFVVFEDDVEFGLVGFDEGGFEEEGFDFWVDDGGFEIGDLRDEFVGPGWLGGSFGEIRADSVFEIFGFADVNCVACFIFEAINAWLFGKIFELGLEDFGEGWFFGGFFWHGEMKSGWF